MSFKASSSMQVTEKPSPVTSKSTWGCRDFKIPRVRLADYLILTRIISRDLVGKLSRIWVARALEENSPRYKKATALSTIAFKALS
jgi:hypothetical protein